MTILFITGYQGLSADQRGNTAQAGLEPAVHNATISFTTAAAVQTQLLTVTAANQGHYYRLHPDGIIHFKVGTTTAVTATATNARMAAGQTEFIGVDRHGLYISAIGGA